MRLFDLPDIMYDIRSAIERGEEPSTEAVNLLIKEGPKAVDDYFLMIDEVEAEAEAIKGHIDAMKARLERRETTAAKMKEYAKQILKAEFGGKIKTELGSYWVQGSTAYEFEVTYEKHPEFFSVPEPKASKKALISAMKDGALPADIQVTSITSESVRVRR